MSEVCTGSSQRFSSVDSCPSPTKQNHFLRLLWGILIFLVIFVHTGIDNYYMNYILNFGKFAMPIFFMISGHFIYSADGHAEKKIYGKVKRYALWIVLAKLLYVNLDLIFFFLGYYSIEYVIRGAIIVSDYSVHLWFIYALFLDYAILAVMYYKKVDFSKIYFLIPLFIATYIVVAELLPIMGYENTLLIQLCYVLNSISFFLLGNYIHRNWKKVNEFLTNKMILLFIIGGTILCTIEYGFIKETIFNNLVIGNVFIVIGIFVGSFRLPDNFMRCRPIEFIGEHLIGIMYVIHFAFLMVLELPFVHNGIDLPSWYPMFRYALTCILTLVTAYLIYNVTQKHKGKKKAETLSV